MSDKPKTTKEYSIKFINLNTGDKVTIPLKAGLSYTQIYDKLYNTRVKQLCEIKDSKWSLIDPAFTQLHPGFYIIQEGIWSQITKYFKDILKTASLKATPTTITPVTTTPLVRTPTVKLERFSPIQLRKVIAEMDAAVKAIGETYGITANVKKNFTYSPSHFTTTIEGYVATEGVESVEQEQFNRYAHRYGLTKEDFGKTFRFENDTYTLNGIRPRASKYIFIGVREGDGKRVCFTKTIIQHNLNR